MLIFQARKLSGQGSELSQLNRHDKFDSIGDTGTDSPHRSESEPRRFVYDGNSSVVSINSDISQRNPDDQSDGRRHLTRRQMMPRNRNDGTHPNQVKSPQRVARAGSQDSVGSTHSDISHDRSRAHNMLAKSSQLLLNKRQGSSLERKEPSHFPQHMNIVSSGPRHQTPVSLPSHSVSNPMINNIPAHMYRSPTSNAYHPSYGQSQGSPWSQGSPSSSRIVQYMHEVALYAGVEPTTNESSSSLTQSVPNSSSSLPISTHFGGVNTHPKSIRNQITRSSSVIPQSDHDSDMDQPVNYSLKYQDPPLPAHLVPSFPTAYTPQQTSLRAGLNRQTTNADTPRSVHNFQKNLFGNSTLMMNPALQSPLNSMLNNPRFPAAMNYTSTFSLPNNPSYDTLNTSASHANFPPSFHQSSDYPIQLPTSVQLLTSTPQRSNQNKSFHSFTPTLQSLPPPHQSLTPSHQSHAPSHQQSHTPSHQAQSHTNHPSTPQNHPSSHQSSHLQTVTSSHLQAIQNLSAYAETDLDSVVDQPTDFSLRYSELDSDCR